MSIHKTWRQVFGMLAVVLPLAILGSLARQSDRHAGDHLPPPFATPSAVKFPKVAGWPLGMMPKAPVGFAVDALAIDIESPRWLHVLPNGDILVAQSKTRNISKADEKTKQA